jgi:hypothetical protein
VRPFHRKWRNQTSPVGLPLDFSNISPWGVILFVLNFQRTSPFTGYLSLSRNFIFIITFLTKVCCFRICSRLFCSTPRVSAFSPWFSKSQMVHLIP